MAGAGARRVGDHFKESGISARAADAAVVVGSVAFAICGSVGVIAAVPSRLNFLETLGKRTLQVYVIHRLVRGLLKSNGFYELLTDDVTMLLVCVELSIVICCVAAIKPIKVTFDKVTSCRWGWALRE